MRHKCKKVGPKDEGDDRQQKMNEIVRGKVGKTEGEAPKKEIVTKASI